MIGSEGTNRRQIFEESPLIITTTMDIVQIRFLSIMKQIWEVFASVSG